MRSIPPLLINAPPVLQVFKASQIYTEWKEIETSVTSRSKIRALIPTDLQTMFAISLLPQHYRRKSMFL